MTTKHYFAEPLVFEFTAQVISTEKNEDGTSTIILDETYFYPEGGGQSADKGTVNNHKILNIYKEGNTVFHVIEGELTETQVTGKIDAEYRRRNMAAHTGQHSLSAAFLRELNAGTLAVKMNAYGLSTVDIDCADLTEVQINTVENLANTVITENRAVKSYFVSPDSPKLDELRRAVKFDKVSGDVRLVEIENFDLSACAGTHFPFTGMLGLLKILKTENYKGGSRIHFAVGQEALVQFRLYQQTIDTTSNLLSSGIEQIPELVEKLQSERSDLAKKVAAQSEQLLSYEAQEIIENAPGDAIKLSFENRDNGDLRTLANLLTAECKVVAIANKSGEDVTLIVASAEDSDAHAGNLLRAILAEFDGRGGGRDNYAQGVLKNFSDVTALMNVIDNHIN